MLQNVRLFGFRFALVSFVAATGYCIAQILQVAGLLAWPWDEIAIYGCSLVIAWPFLLAMLALHLSVPQARRLWSGAGLLFALLYAAYVVPLYALQLATAIPLRLQGTANPLFDVHRYSLFWTLDGMGYICMGLATLFAARAFAPGLWVRRAFLANGLFTAVIAVIYFYQEFSIPLLLLGTPWIVTAPGSILLLALWFRAERADPGHG